ncbi:MAG: BTAD domain-containing putative transcriptional regulator, partial [Gemmatimonadota bacterium]
MFELRCFGQVTVVDDAGLERRLRSRKHLGLLVYLLAHPRTTHPREDLAYLLWDGTGSKARHSLSQALYDIRSNVDGVMDVSSTSVRIRPGRILYHAEAFERAVESGDHNRALDLYHGEFAPDLQGLGVETFDRWVDAEREHCRVLASLGLRNAQRAAEERGDWDRMCLASLHLVQMNEFDEEAHCALMRGLWMKGDPASALRHYRVLSGDLTATWALARDLAERIESSGSVREVLTVPR